MLKEETTTNEILDSLAEGVFTVDNNFKINFFNDAAERITGLIRMNVIGSFCKDIFKSELCGSKCPIATVLEKGKSVFDLESQIQNSNGDVIPIRLNAALIRNKSLEPSGGVISFRDMSAYKEIKKYLEHQTQFYGIVGISKPMREIYNLISEIANTDATVFIYGETGTGKEMVADAIHSTSERKSKKFVKVNCSVLPPQLLASELFGHAKGAFTDAVKERVGRFEFADGGTILLDEVAEMPLQMQLQLLRVIQEGTFERLGESVTRKVNVRIIASTNINLRTAIEKGSFREDLFYRLNVIPIEVPPLKCRKEDIPLLVSHFLKKYSLYYKKEFSDFDDKSYEIFNLYDWPGNIRELENSIEYAVIRSKPNETICACNLPLHLKGEYTCKGVKNDQSDINNSELLKLLEEHRWNKSKVAKELGINRSTLWRRLKSIGVN
jgi:PAS domain S-box-containing protein